MVADLHLEKGSAYAARGVMLPPYDTAATLAALAAVIARHRPAHVIALGDSFHDRDGGERLSASDRAALKELQRGREWSWVAGNHDPGRIADVGGRFVESLRVGPLTFRHEASGQGHEVAGHFHPVARISARGRSIRRRCFASSRRCLVLPAFGAFTGGLNIRDLVFERLLGADFLAHMLGTDRLYSFAAARCLPD